MGKKSFKELTTLKVGGEIDYYFEVTNKSEVLSAVNFAQEKGLPIFVIGEGSDILASDNKFKGVVVKILANNIRIEDNKSSSLVTAEAGLYWDKLVAFAVSRNLQGIECLSGIPGTVGASPIQNIGAYGMELKDSFLKLEAFDIKRKKFVMMDKSTCAFSYRESFFKKPENWQKYIIWSITLRLSKNKPPLVLYESLKKYILENKIGNPNLKEVRDLVLKIRASKFENYKKTPNAGSFFKNPILKECEIKKIRRKHGDMPSFKNSDGTYKCFAGWFIEKAGWKGKMYKEAGVSANHALILINPKGDADAKDLVELSNNIIKSVYSMFRVKLEREVQLINF